MTRAKRSASIVYARAKLSELVREVELEGIEVEITRNGRIAAKLVPAAIGKPKLAPEAETVNREPLPKPESSQELKARYKTNLLTPEESLKVFGPEAAEISKHAWERLMAEGGR